MANPFSRLGLHAPIIVKVLQGPNAACGTVTYPVTEYMEIVEVREAHTTAATDATNTLTIEKLTGTTAPGSGANMFKTTTIDLKGTANTVQRITVSQLSSLSVAQKAAQRVVPGDRIGLAMSTSPPTTLAGMGVTIVFRRTRQGMSAGQNR